MCEMTDIMQLQGEKLRPLGSRYGQGSKGKKAPKTRRKEKHASTTRYHDNTNDLNRSYAVLKYLCIQE